MIRADRVTVEFKRSRRQKLRALDALTLEVPRGSFFALLGENGAGKSTAMYCFLGLLKPTSGTVTIGGQAPVLGSMMYDRIAYLPEEPHYPDYLTVQEAVDYYAALYGSAAPPARRLEIIERLGLGPFRTLRVAKCSKGMKQKVGIAQCLLNNPELLFLDEPMRGLDPAGVHDFRSVLIELNKQGATIVMNSHILSEVESVATQVAVLHRGRLVASGDVASLTRVDDELYDVAFAASELPPMVTDAAQNDARWTGTTPKAALNELVGYLQRTGGTLLSCQLKRMSLEDRFLSIIREERQHG